MKDCLVSVIIPAYNREAEIARALDSVFSQDYPNIEIVVSDDGSSDRTCEVVRAYGGRVKLVQQANAGPGAARNRGVEVSCGEILMFLDSDDFWHPSRVSRQVALMTGRYSGVACSWCNTKMIYADGSVQTSFDAAGLRTPLVQGLWYNVDEIVCSRFILLNQGIAVHRQAFMDVGGYAREFRWLEDHDLALRLARYAPWTFISEPLVTWVGGASNSLSEDGGKRLGELLRIQERVIIKALSDPIHAKRCRRLLSDELVRIRKETALWRMQSDLGARHLRTRMFALCLRVDAAMRRRLPWHPRMAVQEGFE